MHPCRAIGFVFIQALLPSALLGQHHAELELVRGFSSDVTIPLSDLDRRSLEYASLPYDLSYGMGFSASLVNHGPDTALNVRVDLDVLVDGDYFQSYSTNTISQLPPGSSDTLIGTTDLDVLWTGGSMSFQFQIHADVLDSISLNNLDTVDFAISGEEYTRYSDGWTGGIPASSHLGYTAATRFEVPGEYPIGTCVLAYVMPYSEAGIVGIPHGLILNEDLDVVSNNFGSWLEVSDLSLPGETNWIIANSYDNTVLEPGHDYYAAFTGFVPGAEVAYYPEAIDSTAYIRDDSTGVWSMLHVTPMIKIILVEKGYCSASVKEADGHGFRVLPCAPDPCSSNTLVRFTTQEPEHVVIVVREERGAVVEHLDLGILPPGSHDHRLDLANLTAGCYSITVATEQERSVQRLVILPE